MRLRALMTVPTRVYRVRRVCRGRLSDCRRRSCCSSGLSGGGGRPMGASEVIRKLLRIGSNGLYTRKNIPATSHQLAHLTGTSVEPQLGLKPIYLRGQLYPRFFN